MRYQSISIDRRFWLWVFFALSIIFLSSFLFWLAVVSLDNGTHMNTYAANGTFQLYNPLRRLAAGQAIGYDFPFFHGVGIPYLHLPLFILLGSGVFAAETAKWVISPLIFLASSFAFFYAYFRDFKKSTVALAIMTVVALNWIDVVWPGNSLIGVRGTLPVLAGAALIWKTNRKIKIKHYTIHTNEAVALGLLGLSLPFGTEQGTAAILAYALVKFIAILRTRSQSYIKDIAHLAVKGLFIIAIALISYTLLTKGHPVSAIKYAFIDVPMDQGWYFGTDAQGFLTWSNLLPGLFPFNMRYMWLLIILGTVSMYALLKLAPRKNLQVPVWYLAIYGTLAFILTITGYYTPSSQLLSLQRVASLVLVIFVVSVALGERAWQWQPTSTVLHRAKTSLLIALLVSGGFSLLFTAQTKLSAVKNNFDTISVLRRAKTARHSDDYFASAPSWKSSIDSFRPFIDPTKKMWSLYASVYETSFDQHWNPSSGGEDYIIHALGDTRREAYVSDFISTKPDYVTTLKPNYFDFEEWIWDYHWSIYERLLTNYTLVAENASHYLWKINDDDTLNTSAAQQVPAQTTGKTITLPKNDTKSPIIYTVNLTYTAHAGIPLTSRLPRYLIKINTVYAAQRYRISLPSQKNTWVFPVIVMPGESSVRLTAETDGIIPFANLTFISASYSQLEVNSQNIKPIENNACFIQRKLGDSANYPWICDASTQVLTMK